ncbi:MAG: hypothetical protein KDK70_14770, partial [Myxococcales bacterium]|nr:hypothetical protein [Myxococcales bacterium]
MMRPVSEPASAVVVPLVEDPVVGSEVEVAPWLDPLASVVLVGPELEPGPAVVIVDSPAEVAVESPQAKAQASRRSAGVLRSDAMS